MSGPVFFAGDRIALRPIEDEDLDFLHEAGSADGTHHDVYWYGTLDGTWRERETKPSSAERR